MPILDRILSSPFSSAAPVAGLGVPGRLAGLAGAIPRQGQRQRGAHRLGAVARPARPADGRRAPRRVVHDEAGAQAQALAARGAGGPRRRPAATAAPRARHRRPRSLSTSRVGAVAHRRRGVREQVVEGAGEAGRAAAAGRRAGSGAGASSRASPRAARATCVPSRTGEGSTHLRGVLAATRRRGPAARPRRTSSDITSASRSGSIGGFVTWAKRCLKYEKSRRGRSRAPPAACRRPSSRWARCPRSNIGPEHELQLLARVAEGAQHGPARRGRCSRPRSAVAPGDGGDAMRAAARRP